MVGARNGRPVKKALNVRCRSRPSFPPPAARKNDAFLLRYMPPPPLPSSASIAFGAFFAAKILVRFVSRTLVQMAQPFCPAAFRSNVFFLLFCCGAVLALILSPSWRYAVAKIKKEPLQILTIPVSAACVGWITNKVGREANACLSIAGGPVHFVRGGGGSLLEGKREEFTRCVFVCVACVCVFP